jgi:gag-polypeptide of LTR copia-type
MTHKNEALRIISFTVSDRLQGPILYGKTARGAWEELQKVHAPKDKQRKYSLLKCLYLLDMKVGSSLIDHELCIRQSRSVSYSIAIGKVIDAEELIILYANSLPVEMFGNWIQSQMAFIDHMSITDFKGRVREEARRLSSVGLATGLGFDPDPNTNVQANFARNRNNNNTPRLFPVRKPEITCNYPGCGRRGHTKAECYKRMIVEEYDAMQTQKAEKAEKSGKKQGKGNQS